MFPGLNILNISGYRAVSLFDTRDKNRIADAKPLASKHADLNNNILTDFDNNLTDGNLNSEPFTDSKNTLIDRILNDGNFANRRNTSINRISFIKYNDLSDNMTNDLNNDIYYNTDISTEEDSDTDEIDSDKISDTEINANSDLDLKSDIFNVIDDKYLINEKEIRIIF
jgi:hypothetical protein